VVEWWSGGVVEWWSDGVLEYWSGGALEQAFGGEPLFDIAKPMARSGGQAWCCWKLVQRAAPGNDPERGFALRVCPFAGLIEQRSGYMAARGHSREPLDNTGLVGRRDIAGIARLQIATGESAPLQALTPPLHHSITPSLHHSTTPPLHHSITPSLHHSTTPPLHHSTTPSLRHSITPPLHHSITPTLRPSPCHRGAFG
jgi:hypothetical protein